MKKLRTTIGVIIDTLGSVIIYVLIAAAILFMAGQAKHYYDVGYGVFSQLGQQLEEEGLIESARLFLIQERVSDYAGQYVAGTYALSSEMTTEDIMKVISGTEVSPYATTSEPAEEEVPAS